jgi:hypothetical protein
MRTFNSATKIVLGVALGAWAGCASSDRAWKEEGTAEASAITGQSATEPAPQAKGDGASQSTETAGWSIDGRWEGKWHSDAGHGENRLRCLMEKAGDSQYRAKFFAKAVGPFEMNYTVMFTTKEEDGKVKISGKADLGWLIGGEYRYEGEITKDHFTTKYDSKFDRGTFDMARPAGGK